MTHATKRVLQVFLEATTHEVYGFELARASGLPSGTIYPILRRMEQNGLLTSRWELIDEGEEGRRKRRYYRLTGAGEHLAERATQAERQALRLLNPGWSTIP